MLIFWVIEDLIMSIQGSICEPESDPNLQPSLWMVFDSWGTGKQCVLQSVCSTITMSVFLSAHGHNIKMRMTVEVVACSEATRLTGAALGIADTNSGLQLQNSARMDYVSLYKCFLSTARLLPSRIRKELHMFSECFLLCIAYRTCTKGK